MVAATPVNARKTTSTAIARRVRMLITIGKKGASFYGSGFTGCTDVEHSSRKGNGHEPSTDCLHRLSGGFEHPSVRFFRSEWTPGIEPHSSPRSDTSALLQRVSTG